MRAGTVPGLAKAWGHPAGTNIAEPGPPRITRSDPRFTELVEALSEASPQFRDWWAEHAVRYFRPAVIAVRHPEAGLIQLEMFQLRLVDQPGLIMVVQVPASSTYLARVRSLLKS